MWPCDRSHLRHGSVLIPWLRTRHYDALVTTAFASFVRLVDSRTEKDTRFDQNVDTSLGNLPLEIGNLFLA